MAAYAQHGTPVVYQPGQVGTVVVQPGTAGKPLRDWNSGVCDCFNDINICLLGAFCGTCLLMRNAKKLDENCLTPCLVPFSFTSMRVKLRTQENIMGSIHNDYMTECWCGPCGNCQMARELQYLGR
ncbi:placenta-specific gene 8 protein-like [Physella acuta]|uniref:placenta-specific gene 8 protein-like n=1 Tax=Physella acuta TaxID=109671 RepID=UPI0027DE8954|nr:placenta-specific gene 8 protein-like [Physella acuta]